MREFKSFILHDFLESDFHGMLNKDSKYISSFDVLSNAIELALNQNMIFDSIEDRPLKHKGIQLTVDDGGISGIELAKYLHSQSIRAKFFIITGFIGKKGFMNSDDIRYIRSLGHSVGSHSHNHLTPFCQLSNKTISNEIILARSILEDILNEDINSFAVPGGEVRNETLRFLADPLFGISEVYSSTPHIGVYKKINNTKFIGRLCIERGMSSLKILKLFSGKGWRINRFNYQIRRLRREIIYRTTMGKHEI